MDFSLISIYAQIRISDLRHAPALFYHSRSKERASILRFVDFRWLAIVDSRRVEAPKMGPQTLKKLGVIAAPAPLG